MLQSICHLQELQMDSDLLRNKVVSVWGNSTDSNCLLPIGHLLIYMMSTEQIECWTKDVTSFWRSIQLLFSSTAFLHIRYSLNRCLILWLAPPPSPPQPTPLRFHAYTDNFAWWFDTRGLNQPISDRDAGRKSNYRATSRRHYCAHYTTGKLRIIHTIFQISYDAKGPITPYIRRHYRLWDI